MAKTEAQRRANRKWDAANTKTAACKLSNAEHAAFKAYAEARGLTVSGALLEYVRDCIAGMEQNDGTETIEQTSAAD